MQANTSHVVMVSRCTLAVRMKKQCATYLPCNFERLAAHKNTLDLKHRCRATTTSDAYLSSAQSTQAGRWQMMHDTDSCITSLSQSGAKKHGPTCIPQGVCAGVSCRPWPIACSSKRCSIATLTDASGKEIGSSGLGTWTHPVDLRLSSQPDNHSLQSNQTAAVAWLLKRDK